MWRVHGVVNFFLNVMGVSVHEYLAQTASMPHIVAAAAQAIAVDNTAAK